MVSSHETLEAHLRLNFNLMYFHKISLQDIDNMVPWERDIYLMMLAAQIAEEKERNNV